MKNRLFLSVALLALLSACSHAPSNQSGRHAQAVVQLEKSLDLKIHKKTLANGLRAFVIEDHRLPVFSYYTLYNVGGRHEGPGTTGATHFLEHMMFKGAKKYGPGQFDSLIEGSGGQTNAYTTFDKTVYYQKLPSHMIDKIIDLEADRMDSLLLLPESFESERKVIFEERKNRYENSPNGQIYLAMMKAVFEKTPYGGSVIGEVKDLEALTREQMWEFFHNFYTPDNAIIVIAGDVHADHAFDQIEKRFGHFKKSSAKIVAYKKEKDRAALYRHQGRYWRDIKLHGTNPNPIFMMAFKGEPLGTRKSFVMDILSSMLGDGESSYFHQKFVKSKRPLLNNIGVGNYTLKKNGVFYISGELLGRTKLSSFKKTLIKNTKLLCHQALDERSLQKTKNQYLVHFFKQMQTNSGVAHTIGLNELIYDDYLFHEKELKIYNSITLEEVKKTCRDVFAKGESIFLSVWEKHPKSKKK